MNPRIKFFLSHFFLSLFLICISIILIFFIWYPAPLAKALGVIHIFLILFSISIITGPMLTLLIYKKDKKTLKFDLIVIVIIQLVAFAYGFYIISQGRPAWIVFNTDHFDAITVNEIDQRKIIKSQYRITPYFGPKWVALVLPKDLKQKNNIIEEAIFSGVDLIQRPDLYAPLIVQKDLIQMNAKPITQLLNYNTIKKVDYELSKHPKATAWLPLRSKSLDMVVLINKKSGNIISIVDLRPWK